MTASGWQHYTAWRKPAQQHPNQERPQLPVEEIPRAPEAAGQLVGAALSFVHS